MRRFWPIMVFVGVFAGVAVSGWLLEREMRQQDDDAARASVRAAADRIRLSLEIRINANMQIAEGLASYVAADPDLSAATFSRLAENLMRHRSEVTHMALARESRVVAVYPLKGNDAVLGLDYRDVPDQWDDVRYVMEQGEPIVAGPLELVQGGRAIIGRVPIFSGADWPGRAEDHGGYWGIVSVPIDIDALFAYAGLTPSVPVEIALRGTDGRGADGAVFYGDPALFEGDRSEVLTVRLPGGSWQMAAVASGGWPMEARWPGAVFAASLFGGAVLGAMGALACARLVEVAPPTPRRRHGPLVMAERQAFADLVEEAAQDLRPHGRDLSLLGFELPSDIAATVTPEACLSACTAAVRPDDTLGQLAPGRFVVLLRGAGQEAGTVTAGFVRRALSGLRPEAVNTRFATITLGAEDVTAELALQRLEARLDEAHKEADLL